MKKILLLAVISTCFLSCKKQQCDPGNCDIQKTYANNAARVTITSGIWGTVSSMEGSCMPSVPASGTDCKHCPVQRTVKIYAYTLRNQATPSPNSTIFFDNFSTQLIAEVHADADGFFQANIPAGHYSIAIVENGKLYANETDGQEGLNPITFSAGLQKVNVVMTYKAAF
jgi:hypothetical protein